MSTTTPCDACGQPAFRLFICRRCWNRMPSRLPLVAAADLKRALADGSWWRESLAG